jgi:hypothetical protein
MRVTVGLRLLFSRISNIVHTFLAIDLLCGSLPQPSPLTAADTGSALIYSILYHTKPCCTNITAEYRYSDIDIHVMISMLTIVRKSPAEDGKEWVL